MATVKAAGCSRYCATSRRCTGNLQSDEMAKEASAVSCSQAETRPSHSLGDLAVVPLGAASGLVPAAATAATAADAGNVRVATAPHRWGAGPRVAAWDEKGEKRHIPHQ